MQTLSSPPLASTGSLHKGENSVLAHIQRSGIFRDYRKAFESATGLPLTLRAAGAFQSPLHGSKKVNSFCSLMAATNKACAACLQFQQRLETEAQFAPKTLECFAGLYESAVPVRAGKNLLGFLQTGQVFLRQPTRTRFRQIIAKLTEWGSSFDEAQIESAYFHTPVVPRKQYSSMARLLSLFAQHLVTLSNQCMVSEAQAELPAIATARAFIAAQQGEDLSLADVARAANMSAFYFCKVFRKTTGLTYTDYLARVRVETVKQMLLNPHARMSETAYAAGFQSLSQFNRVFHRVVGEPPSHYHSRLHAAAHRPHGSPSLSHAA